MREKNGYELGFVHFLLDRVPYITAFFVSFVLVFIVSFFALRFNHHDLGWNNIVYMLILATVILGLSLLFDYIRQKEFYHQINRVMTDDQAGLEAVVHLRTGTTHEQRALQKILHEQHKTFMDKLYGYRQQQEQHHHFTNQWVHQMKTPVSVIDLLVQQGEQISSVVEARNLFRSIREENERLMRGLDMILQMARLEKFELDVHIESVGLIPIIRHVINLHKKEFIRWSIYPKIIGQETCVETDRKWIAFVFNQLVSNAIKYSKTKPGNKQLLFLVDRVGETCRVRVKDEGIGIAPQDLPRVFDAFFTGENGRLTSESSGIGLFLVKQVCDRLGHRIEMDSQPDKGTTVTLTFSSDSLYRIPK
ncbi:two-component sensor histidine kinase [Collibacillus ludicampi]|jgi:signal transduction histidine kinase|uniref:histidine kinase n=1 Tax=Collibacillus ludicampi TaxID=2771369 RepID=A0AAV4LEH2_9BACL|nr:sensor histidine kinase [Collibacillus ludicampi]GIM46202.1 two-component sensor histidine kinase [Collibacillus ludicampi]